MAPMLALSLRPRIRRPAVLAVLVAYVLPLSLGAASQVTHGAFHLLEQIQARQARAAAFGVVHGDRAGHAHTYTHTHGGVTHSHAAPVDALLSAADQTEQENHDAVPVLKLSAHTPAAVVDTWLGIAASSVYAAVDLIAPEHPRPLPPLPPPRG
ncbi:MAG: hypothetical protein AB7T31_02270 [Gemmatimonadales bacterium]